MTEQISKLNRLINIAHFLAVENLEHDDYLEWEKLEKQAEEELAAYKTAQDSFWKIAEHIIELRDAKQKREARK